MLDAAQGALVHCRPFRKLWGIVGSCMLSADWLYFWLIVCSWLALLVFSSLVWLEVELLEPLPSQDICQ